MANAAFLWPSNRRNWVELVPGQAVTLVKRTHDGTDIVRYPGIVQPTNAPESWIEIEAKWTSQNVTQGSLVFETGDVLREFFSWRHPFNVFAVYTPDHRLKGWYANVTYPSWVERDAEETIFVWQDLWLDVVSDSHGNSLNLDDDELEDSGVAMSDPALHRAIILARDEILSCLEARTGPFVASRFS